MSERERLQSILNNPHTSTSAYRDAWHAMRELDFQQRRDQQRYDAQVAALQRTRTFVDGRGYVTTTSEASLRSALHADARTHLQRMYGG